VVARWSSCAWAPAPSGVRVLDMPFGGTPESAYAISGIGDAVKAAGGEMEVMSQVKFIKTAIPAGKDLKTWELYKDALEATCLSTCPLPSALAGPADAGRQEFARPGGHPQPDPPEPGQRIADLISVIRPTLTVVDAVRILVNTRPDGRQPERRQADNTVIASHDIVAADAYGATLFKPDGKDIAFVKVRRMGLGHIGPGKHLSGRSTRLIS